MQFKICVRTCGLLTDRQDFNSFTLEYSDSPLDPKKIEVDVKNTITKLIKHYDIELVRFLDNMHKDLDFKEMTDQYNGLNTRYETDWGADIYAELRWKKNLPKKQSKT